MLTQVVEDGQSHGTGLVDANGDLIDDRYCITDTPGLTTGSLTIRRLTHPLEVRARDESLNDRIVSLGPRRRVLNFTRIQAYDDANSTNYVRQLTGKNLKARRQTLTLLQLQAFTTDQYRTALNTDGKYDDLDLQSAILERGWVLTLLSLRDRG